MKRMAICAIALAAMLAGAGPAMAQESDPDVMCFLMMAKRANALTKAGKDGSEFDSAAYYYMALVAERYPDPETLAPIVKASAMELATGNSEKLADQCMLNLLPKLQMIQTALAASRNL